MAAIVHTAMGAFDYLHPDVFARTDRGSERLEQSERFSEHIDTGLASAYLGSHGNPGDYLPHWLLLEAGGRPLLIGFQVVLTLLAALALYRTALLLSMPDIQAVGAAAAFLLLPHTLVFPHQIATEAIHTPLMVIGLFGVVRSLIGPASWKPSLLGGLSVGLASAIRPVTILWPALVAALIVRTNPRLGLTVLLVGLLPTLMLAGFVSFSNGSFGYGESSRDLSRNLHRRVERIASSVSSTSLSESAGVSAHLQPDRRLSVVEYLEFAADYPLATAKHSARDVLMLVAKSGIERLTFDYLGLAASGREAIQGRDGWRHVLETEGLMATADFLYRKAGLTLLFSVVGSLVFGLIIAAAGLGVVLTFVDRNRYRPEQRLAFLAAGSLIIYVVVFSQAVDAVQSRHRAPAEAPLVLFAAIGVAGVWRKINSHWHQA